jgi:hypothetical protein
MELIHEVMTGPPRGLWQEEHTLLATHPEAVVAQHPPKHHMLSIQVWRVSRADLRGTTCTRVALEVFHNESIVTAALVGAHRPHNVQLGCNASVRA